MIRTECWRLRHELVPVATGWRRFPARHLGTVQYSNRIGNHWIFVFDSYSKFRGYSFRYSIQMKFRPIVTTCHIKQWIVIITKYFQNTSTLTKHNKRRHKVRLNNYTCNTTAMFGLNVFAFILHKVLVNSTNAILYIQPHCNVFL